MNTLARELGRTVRAAIGGWGPTVRLVTIALALTACTFVWAAVYQAI